MNWTLEQEKAIKIDRGNVLVSAGAGSGKTAVLTERIFQLIKNGTPIDSLLVLTFTNAAAIEMKERTKSKLASDPSTEHLGFLVDASYITTFDSFAYSLVRKYHYYLNLPKDLSIIDEGLIKSQKYQILEDIFADLYLRQDPNFRQLISLYALKNDQEIIDFILEIDAASDLKLDKDEYFKNYQKVFFSETKIKEDYFKILNYQKEMFKIARLSLDNLSSDLDKKKCQDALFTLIDAQEDEFMIAIRNFVFPRAPRNLLDEDKMIRQAVKKVVKKTIDLTPRYSLDEGVFQNLALKGVIKVLLDIVEKLNQRLEQFKKEKGVFTFSDIAKMALKLLDIAEIRDENQKKFKYIMVDEYQDTSDIQEAFLNKIANNNVYMVGDIKQSIYRFRNANSDIFAQKYQDYAQKIGGEKIDLNTNFRSRSEVINNINQIFTAVMDLNFGGANYRKDHLIIAGNPQYRLFNNGRSYDHDLYLYQKEDFVERRMSRHEYEATLIAEDIIDKINQGYQVYDHHRKGLRLATYQDFAILLPTKTHFEVYKAIFDKYHLPLQIEKDLEIASSQVIKVFQNLLRVVDGLINENYDQGFVHALISVARSFLFSYKDQAIYEIVQKKDYLNTEICQVLLPIVAKANLLSLPALISDVLLAVNFDFQLIKVGNVMANKHQVEYLYQSAEVFAKLGYSLPQFIAYFESIKEYQISLNVPNINSLDNCIVLMSVHKSKGLEFPIVYYGGLMGRFDDRDQKSRFLMSKNYGIILPFISEKGSQVNFYKTLHLLDEKKAEISEKVRLLYVALTRAKEKIILLSENKEKLVIKGFSPINCLGDLLCLPPQSIFPKSSKTVQNNSLINKPLSTDSEKNFTLVTLDIPQKIISKSRPSKTLSTDAIPQFLDFGTRLHYLLELTDFHSKDTSFIQEENDRKIIDRFLENPFFNQFQNCLFFKEYSFLFQNQKGIIDLLIVEDTRVVIVDYKLKKIDDEAYVNQLQFYQTAIRELFPHHQISCYLISVLQGDILQIS